MFFRLLPFFLWGLVVGMSVQIHFFRRETRFQRRQLLRIMLGMPVEPEPWFVRWNNRLEKFLV